MDLNVIICTYNRSASLSRTLESIRESSIPDSLEWELIVVDNNSADDTKAVVEKYQKLCNFPISYVKELQQGLSHARNRGINEASGRILAFTDDDVIVDRHWIGNIAKAFDRYDVQCIGGKILPLWEGPKPRWLSVHFHPNLALLDYGDLPFYVEKANLWGANLAFKAETFLKYGLFDTNRGRIPDKLYGDEESHFLGKLLQKEERILYVPDAVVHHCISKDRMKRSYFGKWNFDQGELHGILSQDPHYGNIFAVVIIVLRAITISLIQFAVSFLISPKNAFNYQRKAAYRLGFTKGRLRRHYKKLN
jgi:glycosyltransferase involved in cell wall biosynthesis